MARNQAGRLQELAQKVRDLDESPLAEYREQKGYRPVFGEGDPHARLMFIGEAPGKKEAESGRPFVGAAGKLLDGLLESIDLNREDVYITNIVKDRPPENRDPTANEINLYAPILAEQIEIIQPRVIVTLGRFAMNFVLARYELGEKGRKISELHGQTLNAQAAYGEFTLVPLFHPAAALYSRERKDQLQEDFQVLKQFT
jgi:uracil-DNA glycosylase